MTNQNTDCQVSRRIFLGGLFGSVALTGCRMAGIAESTLRVPNLRLGLISDIHVCAEDGDFNKFGDTETFEHALKWFRDQGVDGVVIAGDMAENGMIAQLKNVGEAWGRVFPGNRAPDGDFAEHRVGATVVVDLPRSDFPANAQFRVIPVNSLGRRGAGLAS